MISTMTVSERVLGGLLLGAWLVHAQGTAPRLKASDHAFHAANEQVAIGAEYLVRTFGGSGESFVAEGYLVVEAGVYPAKGRELLVSAGHFRLRVNGKKETLYAQVPGMVAASLKYPDWTRRPGLEAGGGVGGTGIILGRPQPVERFPGDPTVRRAPQPPRAPTGNPGVEPVPARSAAEVVEATALVEGVTHRARAGFLFFAWPGKTKGIQRVELLYQPDNGTEIVIPLLGPAAVPPSAPPAPAAPPAAAAPASRSGAAA